MAPIHLLYTITKLAQLKVENSAKTTFRLTLVGFALSDMVPRHSAE
jgi:hypothetical protein